jgi:TRAP-type C4-dicarboxylate transport system permease small subunit
MPLWSIQVVSSMLIIFSAIAFLVAAWRYSHLHIKVAKLEVDTIPLSLVRGRSILFVLCSMIALVYLWNMPELNAYYGYPVLLTTLAAVIIGMFLYFKRRN